MCSAILYDKLVARAHTLSSMKQIRSDEDSIAKNAFYSVKLIPSAAYSEKSKKKNYENGTEKKKQNAKWTCDE